MLAKPETYMNLSGASVRELVREYEVQPEQDLIVIYDELDLPFGSIRVRPRGSSAGHNGIASVIGALGTQEIMRIRLGVGPDHPVGDGARYVLSQFKKAQYPVLDEVLDSAAEAVRVILKDGMQAAMNRFNRKAKRSNEQKSKAQPASGGVSEFRKRRGFSRGNSGVEAAKEDSKGWTRTEGRLTSVLIVQC